jgi:hypothetical protein
MKIFKQVHKKFSEQTNSFTQQFPENDILERGVLNAIPG